MSKSEPTKLRTPPRSGAVRPSARALWLLRVVGKQFAVTLPQLAALIARTEHAARWMRARWLRAGWVESGTLIHGQPPFVWLSSAGQRACGLDFKPWRPAALGRLPHIAACAEARLVVALRKPEAVWTSERELLREARLAGTPRTRHMPDAEVELDSGLVAVEVELTQKQRARTERIARELLARYDAVWYFAASHACGQLEALAKRRGFERLQVLPFETDWSRA